MTVMKDRFDWRRKVIFISINVGTALNNIPGIVVLRYNHRLDQISRCVAVFKSLRSSFIVILPN